MSTKSVAQELDNVDLNTLIQMLREYSSQKRKVNDQWYMVDDHQISQRIETLYYKTNEIQMKTKQDIQTWLREIIEQTVELNVTISVFYKSEMFWYDYKKIDIKKVIKAILTQSEFLKNASENNIGLSTLKLKAYVMHFPLCAAEMIDVYCKMHTQWKT